MKGADSNLIIISGLPGSGKSTCGRNLARKFNVPYVDYDTLIGNFMENIYARFYQEVSYRKFLAEWRECTYDTFWNVVAENIRLGSSVVASAPLTKEHMNSFFFTEFQEKYNIQTRVLSIIPELPSEILRKRIIARGEPRDDEKIKEWDEYYKFQKKERSWNPDREIIFYPENEKNLYDQIRTFLAAEE